MLSEVILVVGLLAGQSLGLGANKCSWGPSYWCANLPQASACSAVNHCIGAVWEKEVVPVDDDEVCTICKNMVGQARDTLESNETQEELKEVFDGSCDLIPLKLIADECKQLTDQFIPELVETLASEMDPDVVCTVSGLCNSARIDQLLKKTEEENAGQCGVCREGAKTVQAQLKTVGDDQIEMKLLELCGYMDSYSDACMYTVSQEIQVILEILRSEVSPTLCDNSAVCSAFTNTDHPAATDDLQCEFCEKVIKHWLDVYASNSSLEEFRQLLDGICDKLDKNNAAHCKHVVDDYYIPAFQFLSRMDPHMVCSAVGLCGSSGLLVPDARRPLMTLLPSRKVKYTKLTPARTMDPSVANGLNGDLYLPLLGFQPAHSYQADLTEKPTCVLCEYVLHELQAYLQDGQTEAEIKDYVDSICERMPSAVRGECKTFVDNYEPLIVALLVQKIDPSVVCKQINLCDAVGVPTLAEVSSLEKSTSCETCEFVMSEVFSVLQDKDDREMVKNVLESVCYRLPASIDAPCEQFVDKYTDLIMEMIANSLTPDEICDALDLCQASSTDNTPVVKVSDTGCVLCEYVVANLDSILEDKNNEAEIKQALESVCAIMPSTVKKECNQFVEAYTDLIIDMLTHDITPQQLCANIGLCKKQTNSISLIQEDEFSEKGPYCTLCELAITEVDAMLKDKQSEDEIKQILDIVCYQLSAPVHKECLKLVDKYTDEIIQLLLSDYTPQQTCAEISLCVNNEINTNEINSLVQFYETPAVQFQGEDLGCVMCEFAMQVIDEHLSDAPTVEQVERTVQFICSYLPGSIADQCESLVDQYGQQIIDALVNGEFSPKQVCSLDLGLCTAAKPLKALGNCGWSMEFWCATPFHAQLCGATQLCQETVWKDLNKKKN